MTAVMTQEAKQSTYTLGDLGLYVFFLGAHPKKLDFFPLVTTTSHALHLCFYVTTEELCPRWIKLILENKH